MPERLAPDPEGIARAAELVNRGEVIGFPTDTVYGLMALPGSAERIYEAKRRPAEKRLVVMVAEPGQLDQVVQVSERARAYAERYLPGPLTLVLPAADPGQPALGVRIPDHELARRLLAAVGRPVVTTSANLSGEPPAKRAEEVGLDGVAAVLDGGPAPGGEASTVLLLDRPDPEVTREGGLSARELLLFDQSWKMRLFAEHEAPEGGSPLYAAVCSGLAQRPEVLELLLEAQPGQRRPNLLLAAVHDLLLAGAGHRLAAYYPSVGGRRAARPDAAAAFADFVAAHRDAVLERVRARSTQTNEVGRSALLLLALDRLPQPLALVDAGASAGLNLNLDRYAYRFGAARLGDVKAAVQLECAPRGPLPVPRRLPEIVWRAGLDRSPVDVAEPAAARWLEALTWPEHEGRRRRLRAAIAVMREHPVEIRRGDVVGDLPALVEEARRHSPSVVVVHTQVLTYLPDSLRRRFVDLCAELGTWRVGLESSPSRLTLNGVELARADPHGGWVEWVRGDTL